MKHPAALARLVDALHGLPGIGPKTAQRLAFKLLQDGRGEARELAQALEVALAAIGRCRRCRMLAEGELCPQCESTTRDDACCAWSKSPADVIAVENSGAYRGRYFVLMGHLSPLDGIGPAELGLHELDLLFAEGAHSRGDPRDQFDGGGRGHRACGQRDGACARPRCHAPRAGRAFRG